MLGAIIGDISGSRFEWNNIKTKEFELLSRNCSFTDDSVMSLAVCRALLDCREDHRDLSDLTVRYMQSYAVRFPDSGYGGRFGQWIYQTDPEPYNSWGNGAAMRVSGCGYAAGSLEEAKELSFRVTCVTHDHPEGIRGAEATAVAVYLAGNGSSKEEIRRYITGEYYDIDFTLDDIRDTFQFDESCMGTVPYALEAFFEASDYEDTVRNAISIGGDSDTLAAIAGSVAEAYFGIPETIRKMGKSYLDPFLLDTLEEFEEKYPGKITG